MAPRHVVVDGSNIATEGRSMPSLAQLDQAVREFLIENPTDVVTVVVDASFGHRIDSSELDLFEGAEEAGELVSPPAGAIGRGDAFLLRIADKTGATVLSNDSFQEFHGDYEWLFERGRLIGGKPVPGVGWIFTPRTPVRGPRSREAVQEAKRKKRSDAEPSTPGLDLAAERSRGKGKGKKNVERAIAVALEEVVAPKDRPKRRRTGGGSPPAEAVNDPLAFITFIAAHPLGTEVTATVESFASHGAFVEVEGARCYVPLSAMGDPPPKSAREVLAKGESATFVIQALDPQRRGVELALPRFAKVAGAPTEETVEAEIESRSDEAALEESAGPAPTKRARKKAAGPEAAASVAPEPVAPAPAAAAKKSRGRRGATPPVEADSEPAPEESVVGAEAAPGPRRAGPAKRAQSVTAAAGEKASARKRAPARRASPLEAPPVEPPASADEAAPVEPPAPRKRGAARKVAAVAAVSDESEPDTPEVVASRTRAASRKARADAAPADDADLAFRSAGRKRAPETATPRAGRGGARKRATPSAPVPAAVAPTVPAPAPMAASADTGPSPAAPVKADPAKRAPRTRKSTAAAAAAAPAAVGAGDPAGSTAPVGEPSPPAAVPAKKTSRRRAGRAATTDGAQTPS